MDLCKHCGKPTGDAEPESTPEVVIDDIEVMALGDVVEKAFSPQFNNGSDQYRLIVDLSAKHLGLSGSRYRGAVLDLLAYVEAHGHFNDGVMALEEEAVIADITAQLRQRVDLLLVITFSDVVDQGALADSDVECDTLGAFVHAWAERGLQGWYRDVHNATFEEIA